MVITGINEIVGQTLFAIKWASVEMDVFSDMIEKTGDTEWLYHYFKRKEASLRSGYYKVETIEDAVIKVKDEASDLVKLILELASNQNEKSLHLSNIFRPLDNRIYVMEYKASKARLDNWDAMLRVYAIKLDLRTYIITGWGIKLVKKMQEDIELMKEIERIKKVEEYLNQNKIYL